MAITKIWAIKKTLTAAIKYIENPKKTEGQLLLSGYNVEPLTAAVEMEITKVHGREVRGRRTNGKNVAYHLLQSFSPEDDIDPQKAHELGKKLADEFLGGKYEYVIATHIDKGHIHNHIIINSVSFCDFKKLQTVPYKTAAQIRNISDRLCAENNLSIPLGKGKGIVYGEFDKRKKGTSWKSDIRKRLNFVLEIAKDYSEFQALAGELGVIVNDEGKHIKYKMLEQERWTRGNKLSDTDTFLKDGIEEKTALNKINIFAVETAVQSAAEGSLSVQEYKERLKENGISLRINRNGNVTYVLSDPERSKVKDYALDEKFSYHKIVSEIELKKDFDWEKSNNLNIQDKFNENTIIYKPTVESEIKLEEKNIIKTTDRGMIVSVPASDGSDLEIYFKNTEARQDKNGVYLKIGNHYKYYGLTKTEEKREVFGEDIIRSLTKVNDVAGNIVDIPAENIKFIGKKSITIFFPEEGLEEISVPIESVYHNNTSYSIELWDNWTYSAKNNEMKVNVLGNELKAIIERYKDNLDNDINKIIKLNRYTNKTELHREAQVLFELRQNNISSPAELQKRIWKLSSEVTDLQNRMKILDKNEVKVLGLLKDIKIVKEHSNRIISRKKLSDVVQSAVESLEKEGLTVADEAKIEAMKGKIFEKRGELQPKLKEVQAKVKKLKDLQEKYFTAKKSQEQNHQQDKDSIKF